MSIYRRRFTIRISLFTNACARLPMKDKIPDWPNITKMTIISKGLVANIYSTFSAAFPTNSLTNFRPSKGGIGIKLNKAKPILRNTNCIRN